MVTISLNNELAKKLDQGMRAGDAIELPFPVVYVWALNGQPSYKSQGSALYYGGWACTAEDLLAVADQQGIAVPEWKEATITSRDGGEYDAFTTRNIVVAPIGKRESWLHDNNRYADYVDGGRRHLQVLAYLGESRGTNGSGHFEPWGPVVLTAKGYQARNLLDAFNLWNKATAPIRWKVAPGVPAWCFYLSLGTYGKERHVMNVGKPGAQSPITPITAYIPERFDEDLIANLFVGEALAEKMADLQDQASDWLSAWKETALAEEVQETGFIEDEPQLEDIPF